jgi:hypothetical protein
MAEYDTFIEEDFETLKEDTERLGIMRDLSPGKRKYRCFRARFIVSKDESKYEDRLWIRLGRGQLVDRPCSVRIVSVVDPLEAIR